VDVKAGGGADDRGRSVPEDRVHGGEVIEHRDI
jgi:hypothetical protein